MDELEQLCREAEAKVALLISPSYHSMPAAACDVAQRMYATCVDLCQHADLPLSSIRISLSAWGKKPNVKDRKTEHATELRFDGSKWAAVVAPHQRRYTPYAEGWGDLCLEERPAKRFEAVKLRGQDRYGFRVVQWHATTDYGADTFEILDPWGSPPPPPMRIYEWKPPRDTVEVAFLPAFNEVPSQGEVDIYRNDDTPTRTPDGAFAHIRLRPGDQIVIRAPACPRTLSAQFLSRQGEATLLVTETYLGSTVNTFVIEVPAFKKKAPTWTTQGELRR